MGMRWVIVGTMLRGALEASEPLDESGQVLARYGWELEQAAALRDTRVVWKGRYGPRRDTGRERLPDQVAKRA